MRDHGNFFFREKEGGRDDRARKKEPCIDNRSFAAFNVVCCTVQHMHFYDSAAIVEITTYIVQLTWLNVSFSRSIISVVAFIEFFLQHDLHPYTT